MKVITEIVKSLKDSGLLKELAKQFKMKLKNKQEIVCFGAILYPNLLIPSPTLINTLFTGNNAIFNPTPKAHFFTLFNQKNTLKYVYKETTYTFFYDTFKN